MKSNFLAVALVAATMVAAVPFVAKASNELGVNCTTVLPGTDAYVSVPFTLRSEGQFTATGTSGSSVTIAGPLTVGGFANTYYLRFTSGAANGKWSTITANSATSLTVEDATVLSGVVSGDTFQVFRHHTFDSVFPGSFKSVSFIESSTTFNLATQVLIPFGATQTIAINKPAAETYYYFANGWRRTSSPGFPVPPGRGSDIIKPQQLLIIRNTSTSAILRFYTVGRVEVNAQSVTLPVSAERNDIPAATGQPVPVTLSQLNLGGTSAWKDGTSAIARGDELHLRDNSVAGTNKPAQIIYFRLNGEWFKLVGGGAAQSAADDTLAPGASFFIRKDSGTPGSVNWRQNSPLN